MIRILSNLEQSEHTLFSTLPVVFPIHEVKGLCERTEGLAMSQPLDVKMCSALPKDK
jgi:hypothetical protein